MQSVSLRPLPQAAKLKAILVKLTLYYLLFAPIVAMPFYNTILFHPKMTGSFEIEWISGLRRQEVYFPAGNGRKLNGWMFENPKARKTLLLSHGNGGNLTDRAWLAKLFLESGFSVFLYDYQGYGKSKGQPTIPNMLNDGLAAYDYLVTNRSIPPESIVLFGESLGTGVACFQASKRPAGGLILQQPYTSLDEIAKSRMPFFHIYPRFMFPAQCLNNMEILRGVHPPLLVVHGKKDRIIPHSQSESLMRTASEPKQFVFLPNTGHNDIYFTEGDQYKASVIEFLNQLN